MAEQSTASVDGNSTEAIVNGNFSLAVSKERAMELISNLAQAIHSGHGDVTPFVIGMKDGKPVAMECEVDENGIIKLPDLKVNSKEDIKKKNAVVNRIMKKITPVLQAEIESVTYVALMRKDMSKLDKVLEKLNVENITPKLVNRAGCIFLVLDDVEFCL